MSASQYQRQRREQAKERAQGYLGGQCAVCGNQDRDALQFVHKDPDTAEFKISQGLARKWDVLRAELDKCVLLCKVCISQGGYALKLAKDAKAAKASKDVWAEQYTLAGQEWHAEQAVREHNEHMEKWISATGCLCDFCEDERHGITPPPAYRARLGLLKDRDPIH